LAEIPEAMTQELALAQPLPTQGPAGSDNLYDLHTPEVKCIHKSKPNKDYEFAVTVGVVTCLKEPFILAAHGLPGIP
jgi:hypothetical protein